MRLFQHVSGLLGVALAAINVVHAGSTDHSVPLVPSIEFQRFKLIDGFPYAEFSLVNPTDSRIWFLAVEGHEPSYKLEVRTRDMKWQDASPGYCGLTQFNRIELSPRASRSFVADLPVLSSVLRIKVPIYKTQDGPEQQLASPPVSVPADLVRPATKAPVVPPDELVAPRILDRPVPEYPEMAMRARIEGTVVLRVVVGPSGAVENIQIMKGEPLLAMAAVKAVKTWRYSPIIWRGEPASAILTEKVAFRLQEDQ